MDGWEEGRSQGERMEKGKETKRAKRKREREDGIGIKERKRKM